MRSHSRTPRSPSVSSSTRTSFRQILRQELLEAKFLSSSKSRRKDGASAPSPSPSASFISLDGEDIEHREQMERDRIVAMYDKGPDNPNIGQWERSEWEGYKRVDRYGFVQKDPNFVLQDSPRKLAVEVHFTFITEVEFAVLKNP
ncbi:unnamed protein product, partial [Mesorhabditis belari]|uniref:Uncharacterized protein n=1 Tax=Mesorhabditis belari TaxID=2138241 RepID=A0AAF3J2U0_9BILA